MSTPTKSATYASLIGVVLAEERERKVFTQAAVAEIAGLTQSTWGRMELGRACSVENLGKASKALNIELWELFKAVDDRANGLKEHGVQVVFELPNEEEIKAHPEAWLTGTVLRTTALVSLGAASAAAVAGVTAYISSIFKSQR